MTSTYIDLSPGICCIWFINNIFLNILRAIELSNRISATVRCQRFIMDEIEDILPRITMFKFKFQSLPLIYYRDFVLLKLNSKSIYYMEKANRIICTPYSLAFTRDCCIFL